MTLPATNSFSSFRWALVVFCIVQITDAWTLSTLRPSRVPLLQRNDKVPHTQREHTLMQKEDDTNELHISASRRSYLSVVGSAIVSSYFWVPVAHAKCADVDSCREIGERKEEERLKANPIIRLGDGLVYKVVTPGVGTETVPENGKVDIAFSISQANGSYMYSRGFGFNKLNVAGQMSPDVGSIDSLLVSLGSKDIPVGIQRAIVGMKKGEKRRINCPTLLGFETSDWNPQPTDFRGRQQIIDYKTKIYGRGDTQPPFPAPTIWEVEVLRIR